MKKTKKISILYIESDTKARIFLSQTVANICSKLYIAKNAKEGLELYKLNKIDIVISAIKICKNNLDVLKKIRVIDEDQLIIFTITPKDSDLLFKAIEFGADFYITEPANTKKIIQKSIEQLECKKSLVDTIKIDITNIDSIQERLSLLAQAVEQMDEMVRITDPTGNIIYVNEATLKYTKYKKSELIGTSNRIFKSDKHTSNFYESMWDTILSNKPYQNIFINLKKNGEVYYEDQTITPMADDNGDIKYFVSTSKDVTDRIEMEKKLKLLAITDGLTGIYNRYKINMKIEEECSRVNRYGGSFALIMLDVDFFKKVNDKYGHDIGDDVLIKMSKIVSESIRDTDKFGRWGGEEFMILAPELNKKDAINLAKKLKNRVGEYNFKDVGQVTISLGVVISKNREDKELMLKDVDNALYEAKNGGRNKVVFVEHNS